MKKIKNTTGEQLMQQRIQRQLTEQDQKNKTGWKHIGGGLYKKMLFVFYAVTIYSFLVLILNELIFLIMSHSGYVLTDAQQAFYRSNGFLVHGLFALAVVSFILMLCKRRKTACCLSFIMGILLILQMVQIIMGEYANQGLLAGLYSPVFLTTIASVVLFVIMVSDEKRLKKAIEKEHQKIYVRYTHGSNSYDMLTDTQWDEMIERYETALQNGEEPPKTIDLNQQEG